MRFPNAYKGVGRIYKAQILMLITAILMIVSGIILIAAAQNSTTEDGALAAVGGSAVIMIITSILMIVAFILNLMGISSAMKDEPSFKTAMICVGIGIGASVLSSVLSSNGTISDVFSWISSAANICVTLLIIQGICVLADKLGDPEMVDKGKRLAYMLLAVQVLALIASIISAIFQKSTSGLVTAGAIVIISAIIDIVAYFMYLGYLSKAKKMLEQ